MAKKEKALGALDEVLEIAHRNGMTYADFQQKETLGLAKIINGELYIKENGYWRAGV